MARRPKKNDIPAIPKKQTTVFQGNKGPIVAPSYPTNHKNGGPHTGLTTNRSKPSGGPGSSGPITSVD